MLNIKNLIVKVENKLVLNSFSLDVNDGETHVIMGPNGSGKSTLNKVIMGDPEYKVLGGNITYNKKKLLKLKVDERAKEGIFLAMQHPTEIEGITNSDFLRTALNIKNNKITNLYDFIKQIDVYTNDLNMQEAMVHRSINKGFSGGEKKKNEILQLMILEPKLILLDEIDSGLDIDSLKLVGKNIKDYKEKHKEVSIIVVTHHTDILKYLKPDYVHIMINGQIVKSGNYDLATKIEKDGYKYIKEIDKNEKI
ncbi:MAG TPA: Fe-S cluster assembly ATPase SufC [Bacilli bacterium]|nr:Fe-S cluster assembly ATPase SufC [Bacilli bacterium]